MTFTHTMTEIIPQSEAIIASRKRFNTNFKRPIGLYGHDSGLHPVNMAIGGLVPGKFTVMAARSGTGKTALSVAMQRGVARTTNGRNARMLMCTWELTSDYMVDRQISYKTGLTNRMLTQGIKILTPEQIAEIKKAYDAAKAMPVWYHEYSTDINRLGKVIEGFVKDCGDDHPVIVIDYLGLANLLGSQLKTYGIADFVNGLKKICNKTKASIVLLVQINRLSDSKDRPEKTDISDSQTIENAADNIIIWHSPEHIGKDTLEMIDGTVMPSAGKIHGNVVKSRDYGVSEFVMNANVACNRFWANEHIFEFEYWKLYDNEDFWKSSIYG